MLMLAACAAAMPSARLILMLTMIAIAGALAIYVVAVICHHRYRLRLLRSDPYAKPFGDVPADHLRSFMGRRQ